MKKSMIDHLMENEDMNGINTLDIKTFVTKTVIDVFDTMLSMEMEYFNSDETLNIEGDRIVGSVGFAGEVTGIISVQMAYGFARFLTASMLGMELDEVETAEEINDVMGELANMIGGGLKSRLCDSGLPCQLTIPSITQGSNFKVTSMKGAKKARFFSVIKRRRCL